MPLRLPTPLRLAAIVSAVWLPSLGPARGPASSLPPLTAIAQDRWVQVSASSSGFYDSDFVASPDFGPFRERIGASAGGAFASSAQSSRIELDGIAAKGAAMSSGFDFGSASSSGISWLSVRFTVASPVRYRARGTLVANGLGSAIVELRRRSDHTQLFVFETSGSNSNVAVDEVGLLARGEYVLRIMAAASDDGQFWWSSAEYDVDFSIEGP